MLTSLCKAGLFSAKKLDHCLLLQTHASDELRLLDLHASEKG